MEKYNPPFELTNKMIELVSEIAENLGKISHVNELERLPKLRRVSRIKTIYSSLAIENNTLSIEQVSDVINNRKVYGPINDIKAVKNAYEAYESIDNIDPFELSDLLKIHGIMMGDLVDGAGRIRSSNVGVYDGLGNLVHQAPSYKIVNSLLYDLFDWLKKTDLHILIKSCVFHYEFEFIHPFKDGNGRMGRLWQTALLSSWKPLFKYVPVENIIKENQQEYYESIRLSTKEGKSNLFIVFMLETINKAIKSIVIKANEYENHISIQINKLMNVLGDYPQSSSMLMEKLNLKSRLTFRKNYLNPAIEAGLVEMTIKDKPTSKNQMYYKKH